MGFNSSNAKSAMGRSDKLKDLFGEYWFDYEKAAKTQDLRPVGPWIAYEYWWFDIITEKGKQITVPRLCTDLDPYMDTYTSDNCPFRASGLGRQNRFYLNNVIWRKQQDAQPAKLPKLNDFEQKLRKVVAKHKDYPEGWEAYQLSPGSSSWTPVYVAMFTANNAATVGDLEAENIYKGKSLPASDVDHGFDVRVKYDAKGTGTGKYQFTKGESNALSDEEMDFLVHKLDVLKFPTPKEAEADWKQLKQSLDTDGGGKKEDAHRGKTSASRLDDDDEGDEAPPARNGKGRGVKEEAESRPVRRGAPARKMLNDDDIPF